MKKPSHPPQKANEARPLTAKRKKILELAMAQLKKTRAQMDPAILKKIRSIIADNPKIMKGLGLDKMPEEKGGERAAQEQIKKVPPKEKIQENKGVEKIDQARNMEVMAKLMALKPSEIDNIKAALLKGKD